MKSRFYDPVIGRFLQPDTLVPDPANPQSLNRYSGACPERSRRILNNPLRYTDPSGHDPRDMLCGNSGQCFCTGPGSGTGPMGALVLPHLSSAILLGFQFDSAQAYYCAVMPDTCGGVNFPGPDWLYEGARLGCDITLICGVGCGAFEAGGGPECFTQDRLGTGSRVLSGTGVVPGGWAGKFLKRARFLRFADEAGEVARIDPSEYRVTWHAWKRMLARSIDPSDIERTIATGRVREYTRNGVLLTGYFDPNSKLFVATANDRIVTVIDDFSERQFESLQVAMP